MIYGYILILISATCFGLLPIFTLISYEYGVTTNTILFLRFAIGTILFFVYVLLKEKGWRMNKKQLMMLILLGGVLYMFQSSFYFTAIKYIPASLAALLLYLNPIFVAILAFFVNKEKLSKQLFGAILVSLMGIILVLGTPNGSISVRGILLAVGAAVCYSIYIVIGDRVTKQLPPIITCAFISLFSSFSFLSLGTFTRTLRFDFEPKGWTVVMVIAILCSVVPMFTFFKGMTIVGPTKAAILSMIEPVVTFIFATLLFGENMSGTQMVGGAAVVAGAILVVLAREKNQQIKHSLPLESEQYY